MFPKNNAEDFAMMITFMYAADFSMKLKGILFCSVAITQLALPRKIFTVFKSFLEFTKVLP
jgi:hypothetical protein